MCLIKKKRFPETSEEQIPVYKIVEKYLSRYLTPVREVDVKLNSILKAKNTSRWEMYCSSVIKGCGVHAYINLEKAQEVLERYYNKNYYIILKCIIPSIGKVKMEISQQENWKLLICLYLFLIKD